MKLSKIPIRTKKFKLVGIYEGIEFEGNVGVSLGVLDGMDAGDVDKVIGGLKKIIVSWNLTDDDEKPLEVSVDILREISSDLIRSMVAVVMREISEAGQLPNG